MNHEPVNRQIIKQLLSLVSRFPDKSISQLLGEFRFLNLTEAEMNQSPDDILYRFYRHIYDTSINKAH